MLAPGGMPEVPSDNNLIQGKNSFDCSQVDSADHTASCVSDAPKAEFFFEPGKTHRLRLINTGSEGVQHFSIDHHVLTVIAYDFIPIQAYQTKVVTLGVGQRADVLVTANAATGANASSASFWMRSNIATCSTAKQPYAMATVYYSGKSASTAVGTSTTTGPGGVHGGKNNIDVGQGGPESVPGSGSDGTGAGGPGTFGGFSSTTLHHSSVPGSPPSISSSGTHFGGSVGYEGSTVPATANPDKPQTAGPLPTTQPWAAGTEGVPDPSSCANDDLSLTRPLYPIALPPPSWTHIFDIDVFVNASNVTLWKFDGVSFRGDYNAPTLLLANLGNSSTADWPVEWNGRNLYTNTSVRMIVNNPGPSQHPMHLHGSNFYVLHEGPGRWDGHTIINPKNPMRRDVQLVRPNGHLVLQFDTNNPGVWPFHCHIAWHSSGGFLTQFIVQPEKIEQMNVPSIMAQTCRDWAAWTGTHIPDQIDSGL
jgi:FtsP/CotA-like multicopper oxidase with cupredoxin domain